MTGQEFGKVFEGKIDKAYSKFFNPTKQNRIFKEAIIKSIEARYVGLDSQNEYDDILFFIKTANAFSLNNNKISTGPIAITGITHVSTLVTVTTTSAHNLIPGQGVTIENVTGITNVNGSFFVSSTPSSTVFTYVSSGAPAGTYTAGSGDIIYAEMIKAYWHTLAVKSKFTVLIPDLNITNATNASPIVITVDSSNNLRSTEQVTISGIYGNTAANGNFYLKEINSKKFALYADKKFLVPSVGNGNWAYGGSVARQYYEWCTQYISDRKIGSYSDPTVDRPKYEMSENFIKFYPTDENCQEITIDYIGGDVKFVDVNDSVTDLENYYSVDFLYYVADMAANIASKQMKDRELVETTAIDVKEDE